MKTVLQKIASTRECSSATTITHPIHWVVLIPLIHLIQLAQILLLNNPLEVNTKCTCQSKDIVHRLLTKLTSPSCPQQLWQRLGSS